MDRSKINVERYGNIRYVEPSNYFDEFDYDTNSPKNGTFSDAINFKYEDYNMAVDLEVQISNRYSCGLNNKDTHKYRYSSYSKDSNSLSFFSGKKIGEDGRNYLTTTFTDVSNIEPDGNGECFGIESISITYQSWMFPEVKIRFIDVRGASVMQPMEYSTNDNHAPYNMIYKSFFLYPYPIYILKVKGFYGMGTSYKLSLLKTSIEFDSSTGNFVINADFIGHMFGIYEDMPMSFVATAPYLPGGREYWKQKCSEEEKNKGGFRFRDENGNIAGPMMTIPEFRTRISEASKKFGDEYSRLLEDDFEVDFSNKTQENERIDALSKCVQTDIVTNRERDLKFYDNWSDEYDIAVSDVSDDNIVKNLVESIDEAINAFREYDRAYKTTLSNLLPFYSKSGVFTEVPSAYKGQYSDKIKYGAIKYENYGIAIVKLFRDTTDEEFKQIPVGDEIIWPKANAGSRSTGTSVVDVNANSSSYILKKLSKSEYEKIEEKVKASLTRYTTTINIVFIPRSNKNVDIKTAFNSAKYEAERMRETIRLSKEKKAKELVEEIKKAIGFYPSIWNVYHLMFAHFETFIHCFYEKMKNIRDELGKKENGNRLKTKYNINELLSDTPHHRMFDESDSEYSKYYPPFTGFFTDKAEEGKKVFIWPPDLSENAENMDEVQFVHELLYAAGNASEAQIETTQKGNENAGGDSNSTSKRLVDDISYFIPLTVYDFNRYFEEKNINPYYHNGKQIKDFSIKGNKTDAGSEILLKLATRLVSSLDAYDSTALMSTIGQNEAVNALISIGDIHTNGFRNFRDNLKILTSENFIEWITDKGSKINGFSKKEDIFFAADKKNIEYVYTTTDNNSKTYIPYNYQTTFEIDQCKQSGNYNESDYGLIYRSNSGNNKNTITLLTEEDYNRINSISTSILSELNVLGENTTFLSTIDSRFKNLAVLPCKERDMKKNSKELIKQTYYDRTSNIYDAQEDFYAKAFLFLQPIFVKEDLPGCGTDTTSICTYKSFLVREGSYYWLKDWLSRSGNSIIYPSDYTGIKPNFNGDEIETFYRKKDKKPYKFKSNASNQRKELLKQYFIDWADSIKPYFDLLELEDFYEPLQTMYAGDAKGNDLIAINDEDKSDDAILYRYLQENLCDLFFGKVQIFEQKTCKIESSLMKTAFESFKSTLLKLTDSVEKDEASFNEEIEKLNIIYDPYSNADLNLSTYLSLKNLYDKWLSFSHDSVEGGNESLWSLACEDSDFNRFLFVDNFYNDIGYKFSINPTKIASWLGRFFPSSEIEGEETVVFEDGKNFYSFLADIAQECGATLMAFPQNFTSNEAYVDENMRKMFTPVSINEDWCDPSGSYVFVFMYSYKPASHLGDASNSTAFDMNGFDSNGDGFDLTECDITGTTNTEAYDTFKVVPAFGVSFGKQNQGIFTNVTLNNNTTTVTEASISGTMNIASKYGQGPRESTLYGQDLYKVYGSYSYECGVEMLGNLQIMPTMFLQLNNVPLWKGVYQIKKVSHDIKAGSVMTKLEGIKVNKYTLPIARPQMIVGITGSEENLISEDELVRDNALNKSFEPIEGNKNSTTSSVGGNSNGKYLFNGLTYVDFDESKVSSQTPLICLTPAHGPLTEKSDENAWSSMLIEKIVEKLKKSNDKPWLATNVHVCNEGGNNTSRKGYSMNEARQLTNYFGSDSVISIVPHWNAGRGQRLEIYWYLGPNNKRRKGFGDYIPNPKSQELANCFKEAFKNMPKPSYTDYDLPIYGFNKIPEGAIGEVVNVGGLRELADRYDAEDGAVMLKCPAVLVETWYCDYNKFKKHVKNANEIPSEPNPSPRYNYMKNWLESPEGLHYVSDLYVNAINMYLDKMLS